MTIWQTIREKPSILVWAIIFHALAFAAIGGSFKSSDPKISDVKQYKVIEAVAISESQIQAEIKKLKKVDKRKKRDQKRLQDKAKKATRDRKKEEKKLRALKKKQKEQKRINKKKRIQENKRLAAFEKKRKRQEKAAQDKLNTLEKKRQKRKAKFEKEEKQRQERKAKLEKEEKQRQAIIADKKRAVEQKRRAVYVQSEVSKYKGLIRGQITRSWVFPVSYQKGMRCKVLVRLIPSGDVISVRIIQSSGNSAFDRSVEMAVNRASPLPVPKSSSGLFEHFREVEFVFDPNA